MVSRKTDEELELPEQQRRGAIAPLPRPSSHHRRSARAPGRDGSLRLRLNVWTRSEMVRNCDDSGGSSVSATRQASSWPVTSPSAAACGGVGQRLQLPGVDQRVAGRTAQRHVGIAVSHCAQRDGRRVRIGGTVVMARRAGNGRGDRQLHRCRELPGFPEADAEDHQAERPLDADRDRQAQDEGSPQEDVDGAQRRGLLFDQERHPAEGDGRVGQDDRQHLVDQAAAPARGPAHGPPDQEADRDENDRQLIAADLRDEIVERRADRAGDEAGAERPPERRAAGGGAMCSPDRRCAHLAERLAVHVEVPSGDWLVAAGAVPGWRRRAEFRALELQIVHAIRRRSERRNRASRQTLEHEPIELRVRRPGLAGDDAAVADRLIGRDVSRRRPPASPSGSARRP